MMAMAALTTSAPYLHLKGRCYMVRAVLAEYAGYAVFAALAMMLFAGGYLYWMANHEQSPVSYVCTLIGHTEEPAAAVDEAPPDPTGCPRLPGFYRYPDGGAIGPLLLRSREDRRVVMRVFRVRREAIGTLTENVECSPVVHRSRAKPFAALYNGERRLQPVPSEVTPPASMPAGDVCQHTTDLIVRANFLREVRVAMPPVAIRLAEPPARGLSRGIQRKP